MAKKIITILGARPQFIKASSVSKSLIDYGLEEIIINTGQHYDYNLSDIFFSELNIPNANYNLNVGSSSHASQTSKIMSLLEPILIDEKPNFVILYGDTNSTLGGALVCAKLHIPIVHIEAGLRSFNKLMPEEINRLITDHVSSILFAPSTESIKNLEKENICVGVYNSGDVMYDIFYRFENSFDLTHKFKNYSLLTLHRAENTFESALKIRLDQIRQIDEQVIFPIHPRTKKIISSLDINIPPNIKLIDPVGWFELMGLIKSANYIFTDSGGMQKEAFWHKKLCYTLRNETEWIETVEQGANFIIKEHDNISLSNDINSNFDNPYGDGNASEKIANFLNKL